MPFRLSQGALSAGYDSPDYYFYVTFGTMPTLYAGIHLLSHDKPGYVFYSRSKTFDPAEFPARAEVTTAADRTADATQAEMEAMAREMKRRILEINVPTRRPSSASMWTTCAAGSATTGSWRRGSTRHGSR